MSDQDQDTHPTDTQPQTPTQPPEDDVSDEAATPDETPKVSVKLEDSGPARKTLTIEIPGERIAEKVRSNFDQIMTEAPIPGFRRGRAPRRLIERRFGSTVREDVKNQLLSEAYSEAIEQHDLEIIGEPEIKDAQDIELPESGPLTFQVDVEVTPEFELPDFTELTVEEPKVEVTDEQVEQEVEHLREGVGKPETITQGTVESGDYLTGSMRILAGQGAGDDAEEIFSHPEGTVHVPKASEGDRGHIGGIVIEDLRPQLVGKQVGDELRVSLTGPSGHENEQIRDQPITIVLRIDRIMRVTPATMEEVLEQVDVPDEDELKNLVRQRAQDRQARDARVAMFRQLRDQLVERVDFELPERLTGRQAGRLLHRHAMELASQGVSEDEIGLKLAEMRSASQDQARHQLKTFFVLDKAAKELDIEVSEREVNGRVAMIAAYRGRRPEKLRQEMAQSGELENLHVSLREEKTLERILELAGKTAAAGEAEGESAGEGQGQEEKA